VDWVDAQEAEKAYNAKIAAEGVRRADAAEAARLAELERIRQRALQVRQNISFPWQWFDCSPGSQCITLSGCALLHLQRRRRLPLHQPLWRRAL
jgi:hypothetical protein